MGHFNAIRYLSNCFFIFFADTQLKQIQELAATVR